MYLYFNGDSFVAGAELGDDILPDYPGLATGFNPNNKWFRQTIQSSIRYQDSYRSQIEKLEYERSFPNKVATKLDVPFINNAKGGASMDRIARTTITDLIRLKKNIPNEKIIAFIGTTDHNRSEIPTNGTEIWRTNTWKCIISNYNTPFENEEIKTLIKYKVLNETDYHTLMNFYRNIILIKDFCKTNNIDLFWVSTHKYPFLIDQRVLEQKEDYNYFSEYANLSYAINMVDYYEKHFKGQKIICPGGHYGELMHDFVADKIVDVIRDIL